MTLFDPSIGPEAYAAIRFGHGYPVPGAATAPVGMLARLAGPDAVAARFPGMGYAEALELGRDFQAAVKARRASGEGGRSDAEKALIRRIRATGLRALATALARIVATDDPFRERLVHFWTDHFTIRAGGRRMEAAGHAFADAAIRPHVAGSFGDLLEAAVLNPSMLVYLDQTASIGPNSRVGQRRERGLNENLAREVLELHTLGAGGAYGQTDVREFAELLTGLVFDLSRHDQAYFLASRAEPGAETVLGLRYGGGPASLGDIRAALRDLAVHPDTAAHVAGKLAAHFTADVPDPALVAAMAAAWRDSGGGLPAVYRAMLEHPAAWRGFGAKVKRPLEFLGSALRALGVPGDTLAALPDKRVRDWLARPMREMGQGFGRPPGPDGFPDTAEAWVQPLGLAQRITWAMAAAQRLAADADPADFARAALGGAAGPRLLRTVARAETRAQGVGAVLASAEFNRR